MEEPKSEEPLENGHKEAISASIEAVPEQPKEETDTTTTVATKIESSEISTEKPPENILDKVVGPAIKPEPDFNLTTKNLERVREELRQEEILQGRKSPFKSETASPVKLETVRKSFSSIRNIMQKERKQNSGFTKFVHATRLQSEHWTQLSAKLYKNFTNFLLTLNLQKAVKLKEHTDSM